jgi:hypothetical protein
MSVLDYHSLSGIFLVAGDVNRLHRTLWLILLLYQIVFGIWALVLGFRRLPIGSILFTALVIDEVIVVVQSLVGAALFLTGSRPQLIHFLYGGLLLVLLPAVYAYGGRRQRAGIWMGVTLLFMAGMMVRIAFTGS